MLGGLPAHQKSTWIVLLQSNGGLSELCPIFFPLLQILQLAWLWSFYKHAESNLKLQNYDKVHRLYLDQISPVISLLPVLETCPMLACREHYHHLGDYWPALMKTLPTYYHQQPCACAHRYAQESSHRQRDFFFPPFAVKKPTPGRGTVSLYGTHEQVVKNWSTENSLRSPQHNTSTGWSTSGKNLEKFCCS